MADTMTTALTAVGATPRARRTPRARQRAVPPGVPRWLWLLGVTVQPLGRPEAEGTRTWVVSAGAGLSGMAAMFFATLDESATERTGLSGEDRS
jgi:hypothetical protein